MFINVKKFENDINICKYFLQAKGCVAHPLKYKYILCLFERWTNFSYYNILFNGHNTQINN